ncbi:GNAT family N-acetyltransferase [Actinophytocola oryzae]|uniref:RimJ/RimL family protein N-acetyltransferase n=1 Tax=Actinophytocola oryzae TaxID=502181 RepID=A0A4R7VVI1_9PSEU|nr:GNAT family N-acetyltransferase [Actinophytocola oryzae]TDV54026.1 RimJ/RimL family protein N-acetyltransferase [Actinophytocola oryzae]
MTQVSESARPERLATARLVLRRIAPTDVDAMIALHADPDATRHRPEGMSPPEHSRQLFVSWLDHWVEFGYGYWAIELVGTGELAGFGGLQLAYGEDGAYLNVFYRLFPHFWGHGYAPEMVGAAVEWGRRTHPELPILIITPTTNARARRVAEKLGFRWIREAHFQGALSCFFQLPG